MPATPPPTPNFAAGVNQLLPAIAQDAQTGRVLMLAWMNQAAFEETLSTGYAVYYSRSREALWRKGETSGHRQRVVQMRVDCDGDTILLHVQQTGAACHEGFASCFFRTIDPTGTVCISDERLVDPDAVYGQPQPKNLIQIDNHRKRNMSPQLRLAELGIELPPAPKPVGVYKPIVVVGNLAYLSGHGPLRPDRTLITGRVGADMDTAAGYNAARLTGMCLLATLQQHLGTLDRVARLVKLLGLVRCTDDFEHQPAVINGCSELFRDVFGEDLGVAARSALGTNSLPGGIAVEIEAIFELHS